MTTIYVTKYAFTEGVFSCDARIIRQNFACRNGVSYQQCFHGKDFWLTEDEARVDFERRRKAKLASLAKSVAKITSAEFKVADKAKESA